jgi:hypothetical protein
MFATLLILSQLAKAPKILFIGNSHTFFNDVPVSVKRLLESDSSRRKPIIRSIPVGLLETAGPDTEAAIKSENWDVVILQGAQVSSSHQYRYSQAKAIGFANLAMSRKAKVLLCAEWPRRGWDESQYQLGVYREIQVAAKSSVIVPICEVWDASRAKLGGMDLWAADGNHANVKGSFLSACTIYRYLTEDLEGNPTWRPNGVSPTEANTFHTFAIHILKSHSPKL